MIMQDPEDFYVAYNEMITYVSNRDNWPEMEEELRGRGVSMAAFVCDLLQIMKNFFLKKSMKFVANRLPI